ncbi:hypothetical protein NUW58_g5758 [Xylaria curta]|uniref:Uncharacterized protein n=1 Tax=Xylaria curta TaxID=42375 RepID=A0ACC1P1P4_9PEZI|nr:hypothetical protein NUW58_g5758 [Xylaria curta]
MPGNRRNGLDYPSNAALRRVYAVLSTEKGHNNLDFVLHCLPPNRMDNALNVSSTVAGALSLAIQIAQLAQTHTSRMANLPRSVNLFVTELVSLKSLLLDIQDALFLQSTTSQPGVITHQTLPDELENIRSELENLHNKLQDAQNHTASLMLKNLIWPFHENETARWSNNLNHCKERINRAILVSGLFLITTLQCTYLTQLPRFSEIKKAVQTTPSELKDLYKDTMERIALQPRGKRLTALKSLSWIFYSKRELSVQELVHALAIQSDEAVPTYEDVVTRQMVLDVCAGLLIIDAKNDSFRFVHHTLYEYFKITHEKWFHKGRLESTRACLTYLRLMSPEKGLTASTLAHPFLHYVAAHWGSHVRDEYDKDFDSLALAAFDNHKGMEMMYVLMEKEQGGVQTIRMFPSPNLAIQLSARLGALPILQLLGEHGHSLKGSDPIGRTALL